MDVIQGYYPWMISMDNIHEYPAGYAPQPCGPAAIPPRFLRDSSAIPPKKANFLTSQELGKRTARTPTGQACLGNLLLVQGENRPPGQEDDPLLAQDEGLLLSREDILFEQTKDLPPVQ